MVDYLEGVSNDLTNHELLEALTLEAELNLRRHVDEAVDWQPHEYVPFDDGRNFAFLGGEDFSTEQSTLGRRATIALTVGVLVADNLPAYHRELASYLRTGVWFRWVGRWTAEENRHAIVLRNYLVTTRAVDPVALEQVRMAHMTEGMARPAMHLLDILIEAAFDEASSAVRHRNTAALRENPLVTAICERIARDEELQAVFFANLVDAAFGIAPDQTMRALARRVAHFRIPTVPLPDGTDSTEALADAGIFEPDRVRELVFEPLFTRWKVAERDGLGERGEQARAELTTTSADRASSLSG